MTEPEQDPRIPCPRCKGSGFVLEPDMTAEEVSAELQRRGIDVGPAWEKIKAALDKARGLQAPLASLETTDAPSTRATPGDGTTSPQDDAMTRDMDRLSQLLASYVPIREEDLSDAAIGLGAGADEIRRLRARVEEAEDECRSLRSELDSARKGDHDHDGALVYFLDRAAESAPTHRDLMRQGAREIEARQAEARTLRARVDALESENGALKDRVEEMGEELDLMDNIADEE